MPSNRTSVPILKMITDLVGDLRSYHGVLVSLLHFAPQSTSRREVGMHFSGGETLAFDILWAAPPTAHAQFRTCCSFGP